MSGWSRCLEICVAQALFVKSFSQMVGCHSFGKSHVFGHEKQQTELNFGIDHIILFNKSSRKVTSTAFKVAL